MDWLKQTFHQYKTHLALFSAIWLIYAVHVVPGGGVNPNRYFDLTHSIVNHGTLWIDAYQENTIDKAFKDGHYYSAGLPGPSVAGIPAYLVFKGLYSLVPQAWLRPLSSIQSLKQGVDSGFYQQDTLEFFLSTIWITVFTLSIISAFSAVLLYRLILKYGLPAWVAFVTVLVYAFGTPVFFFSTTYFSCGFDAAIIIAIMYVLASRDMSAKPAQLLVGILAGMTMLVEYQGSIFLPLFGLYMLYRHGWRGAVLYGLGAALPLSLLLIYNYAAFGSPIAAPHEWLVGPNRLRTHGNGLFGFSRPDPERLLGLTVLPERGLLLYVPIVVLAPLGWYFARNHADGRVRDANLLSIAGTTSTLVWLAAYTDWFGGVSFGPRHLVCILPLLFIGLAWSLPHIPRFVWLPLAMLSILTNWLGAQYGFAENVFQHWGTFFNQGFMLPWALAIVTHSRGSNALLNMVTNYNWVIAVVYALIVAGAAVLFVRVVRSTQQQRDLTTHVPRL